MAQPLSQLYQRFKQLRGRRIFIIPTRFGLLYAAFLILILLGAINYSNSLGHVLAFLLGSLGLVAMLHTYRNLAKIELTQATTKPVFCGQAIIFSLVFDNQSHFDSYHIEISSKQETSKSWNPFRSLSGYLHPQQLSPLTAQHTTRFSYSLPSQQRGKYTLGKIRIASQFPLGLYSTWGYFPNNYAALVYPKPEGTLPLPDATAQGQKLNSQQQQGTDDFAGFNRYRTGDPIHAIAWKAMARDDVLRTKQFSTLQGGQLAINWQDVSQINNVEARLSQLCKWVLQAESSGMSYSLSLPNNSIPFGHGETHRHRCLTALALYE
ncbi:MAG: hypothetical protein COA83_04905 [Methylophaga sp.]|nr:MAG: hypothetical protein COA83_04905 [Methylophaga sp.]